MINGDQGEHRTPFSSPYLDLVPTHWPIKGRCMAEAHAHFRAVLHTQIHLEHRRAQSRGYAAARDWSVIMEDLSTAPAFCVLCGPVSRCSSLAAAPGTKEQATFCPVALPGSMGPPAMPSHTSMIPASLFAHCDGTSLHLLRLNSNSRLLLPDRHRGDVPLRQCA
jgi:hypothetical protein